MKNLLKVTLIVSIILSAVSCSSTKDLAKTSGAQEVNIPFSEAKYQSDKNTFRAVQSGISVDLATSKKVALANAQTELSGKIQTLVKSVTDQYTNQRTTATAQEFENKFEEMARLVVSQNINDVATIGQKVFKEQDGRYTSWVAIEMNKESLLNDLKSSVSEDEKLQIDFDKAQFEKVFNAEMDKFAKNN